MLSRKLATPLELHNIKLKKEKEKKKQASTSMQVHIMMILHLWRTVLILFERALCLIKITSLNPDNTRSLREQNCPYSLGGMLVLKFVLSRKVGSVFVSECVKLPINAVWAIIWIRWESVPCLVGSFYLIGESLYKIGDKMRGKKGM